MARSVYSVWLVDERGFVGDLHLTPDPGFVVVVRDIDVYAGNSGVSPIHFRFKGNAGGTIWLHQVDADTNAVGQWRGRQVFDSDQTFTLSTDGAYDIRVSGYKLTIP